MDFWNDLHSATEAVRTGNAPEEEPPELAHLPPHIRQHLMTGTPGTEGSSFNQGRNPNQGQNPAFRDLPDHLKNNPYAHLSK